MNDQEASYTDAQVKNVNVYGLGGYDTAVVLLSDSFTVTGQGTMSTTQQLPWTAVATAGGGYVLDNTGAVFMQLYNFQNSSFYLPSNVTGYLYTPKFGPLTPPGAFSTFVTAGNYSYVTGNGEFHLVSGGQAIYGFATNASDQVYHYDAGAAQTAFVTSGNSYSYMSGTENGTAFFNVAMGFNTVYGYATPGNGDIAYFYDTPANDTFVGTATYSYMSGKPNGFTYFDEAQNFSTVYAESFEGGLDFSYNYDTAVNIIVGDFVAIPVAARNNGFAGNV
jgi:hypothetical protein